jgi:hypothetical protein
VAFFFATLTVIRGDNLSPFIMFFSWQYVLPSYFWTIGMIFLLSIFYNLQWRFIQSSILFYIGKIVIFFVVTKTTFILIAFVLLRWYVYIICIDIWYNISYIINYQRCRNFTIQCFYLTLFFDLLYYLKKCIFNYIYKKMKNYNYMMAILI